MPHQKVRGGALITGGRRCCHACVKDPQRQLAGIKAANKNPWVKHTRQLFYSGKVKTYKEALEKGSKTYTTKAVLKSVTKKLVFE
jgi:hypothetical protein